MGHKSTMVELVQELEAIEPRSPYIEMMIAEAKAGEYHDFKNNKYVCGKAALVEHCQSIGLNDLAERVMLGEFDEKPDRDDIIAMRRDAIADGCSEQMMEILGLGQDKIQKETT